MNYKLKRMVSRYIPKAIVKPVLNTARLVRALCVGKPNNFAHLRELHDMWLKLNRCQKNLEDSMRLKYQALHPERGQKNAFRNREFRIYSQNGEDGILLYLFSKIGSRDRRFIEFGAGGKTSNTENLIRNFGWNGLLIDCDKTEIERLGHYYCNLPMVGAGRVKTVHARLTAENVNEVFLTNDMKGEIDLLSIDVDGNDFWIWKAIDVIQPRVAVVEYNASLGPHQSLTITYNPTHSKTDFHPLGWYHGASLTALTKLAKDKGYTLIACESSGVNAFFVRKDLSQGAFSEQSVSQAYYEDMRRSVFASQQEQYNQIKQYDFSEV